MVQAAAGKGCVAGIEIEVLDPTREFRGRSKWPGWIESSVATEQMHGPADVARHRRREGDIDTDE